MKRSPELTPGIYYYHRLATSGQAVPEPSTPSMLDMLPGGSRGLGERPRLSLFQQPPREGPAPASPLGLGESPSKRPRRSSALRVMNYMAQEGLDDAVGDPEFRYDAIGAFRNVTGWGGV